MINGQCSAWVSNGAVAQVALGYIGADYGDGFFDERRAPHGMAVHHSARPAGVSKGKPLDKIGQRSLPQGEIYFDNVQRAEALRRGAAGRVLRQHGVGVVVSPARTCAQTFTGVARAGVRARARSTATSASRAASR